jgi:hypothetical protein
VDAAREAVLHRRPTSARPLAELDEQVPEPVGPVAPPLEAREPEPAPPEPSIIEPSVAEPERAAEPAATAPASSEPRVAEPAAGPVSRRPLPRWLLTAILVVAAAAASGAVAYLVARDGSEPTSATPSPGTTTVQQAQAGKLPTLASLVPKPLWNECAVQNVARTGAVESAVCLPSADLSVANSPDRWEVSIYPGKNALATAYETARQQAGVKREGGRCDGSLWAGSGPWAHAPGKPGGERFCYFDGDDAVMVWTHEKLGQPNHRDLLAVAREGGTDHAGLFSWWRFWHHRIGKAGT